MLHPPSWPSSIASWQARRHSFQPARYPLANSSAKSSLRRCSLSAFTAARARLCFTKIDSPPTTALRAVAASHPSAPWGAGGTRGASSGATPRTRLFETSVDTAVLRAECEHHHISVDVPVCVSGRALSSGAPVIASLPFKGCPWLTRPASAVSVVLPTWHPT